MFISNSEWIEYKNNIKENSINNLKNKFNNCNYNCCMEDEILCCSKIIKNLNATKLNSLFNIENGEAKYFLEKYGLDFYIELDEIMNLPPITLNSLNDVKNIKKCRYSIENLFYGDCRLKFDYLKIKNNNYIYLYLKDRW